MKKILIFLTFTMALIPSIYGRDDQMGRNDLSSMKEYFIRNQYDLNPIEGVYKVSLKFYHKNNLIYQADPFNMVVDEYKNDKNSFILSFIGYQDPIDHTSLPDDVILENPGAFIMFGFIYNYPPNSNQYIFRWMGGHPNNDDIHNSFVLNVGANDFDVIFNIKENKSNYWGYPAKYDNKDIRIELEAQKMFPLK